MNDQNSLSWYIKYREEPLLVDVKSNKTIITEDVMTPAIYKTSERCSVYNSWKDKIIYGQYSRDLDGKDSVQSWKLLKDSDLKGCTEAWICGAQELAIRTNNTKCYIDKTNQSPFVGCDMHCDEVKTQRSDNVFVNRVQNEVNIVDVAIH